VYTFIVENSGFLFVLVNYYLKIMYDKRFLPIIPVHQL
jgi:hypothetical protein